MMCTKPKQKMHNKLNLFIYMTSKNIDMKNFKNKRTISLCYIINHEIVMTLQLDHTTNASVKSILLGR